MKFRIKLLIVTAIVLLASAALTFADCRLDLDYCKGVIKLNDGYAVLSETEGFAAVAKLDRSGNVIQRANMLLNNPFTLSVNSVHDMFTDDNGDIYVFSTVYGPDCTKKEILYKCNFFLGTMVKVKDFEQIEGYSAISGIIPQIDGSNIYLPMLKDDKTIDILKISDSGYSVIAEKCSPAGTNASDKIFYIDASERMLYRDGNVYLEDRMGGMFAGGNKIYPLDDNDICSGLNYDNGLLNFINFSDKLIVSCNADTGEIITSNCNVSNPYKLQNIMVYSDGTVTAVREDGEYLRAYYCSNGLEKTYTSVSGSFSWTIFLMFTLYGAAAALLISLLYAALFVRLHRKKKVSTARRYQSIASRITAISTAVGIVCGIVFSMMINDTVKQLNLSLRDSIKTNSTQIFASYILSNCKLEVNDGVPMLDDESAEKFTKAVEGCQQALAENNSIECEFLLFVQYDDMLYNLLSSPTESIPAEFAVSLRSLELIEGGIDKYVNQTFDDNMTSGMYKYTCSNFLMTDKNGNEYKTVICMVIDAYRMRQTGFMLYIWLVAIIFGLVILLLIVSNIILRRNLHRLKHLKNAFGLYENGGEPSVFSLNGGDEIAETGQALMLMTEGTRVHARDINEKNRRYKRFISSGILKLMGHSEISKVSFGEHISVNALIIRFIIKADCDMKEQTELINGFIEMSGGIMLNFGKGKADVCFTEEEKFGAVMDMAVGIVFPAAVFVSYGRVEAGSAGDSSGAWLISLSEEFTELERLRQSGGDEQKIVCTKKAAEKLENLEFPAHCELRSEKIGEYECFRVIPHESYESGGNNEQETAYNNYIDGSAAYRELDPVI